MLRHEIEARGKRRENEGLELFRMEREGKKTKKKESETRLCKEEEG